MRGVTKRARALRQATPARVRERMSSAPVQGYKHDGYVVRSVARPRLRTATVRQAAMPPRVSQYRRWGQCLRGHALAILSAKKTGRWTAALTARTAACVALRRTTRLPARATFDSIVRVSVAYLMFRRVQ